MNLIYYLRNDAGNGSPQCSFPYYKSLDSNECLKCINYITNDLNCVDSCDSMNYKYIQENDKICYNFIPTDYWSYIEDYNLKYVDDNNSPIIKISKIAQIMIMLNIIHIV